MPVPASCCGAVGGANIVINLAEAKARIGASR
jgi:hypothetical protein